VYGSVSTFCAAVGATLAALLTVLLGFVTASTHIVWYLASLLCALVAWRCWEWGIHTRPDGIRVVGLFTSHAVEWHQIDHFAVLPLGRYGPVAHVVPMRGRPLPALGVSWTGIPRRRQDRREHLQQTVDELNHVLDEHRHRTDRPPPS
jgi:hypothetical protein